MEDHKESLIAIFSGQLLVLSHDVSHCLQAEALLREIVGKNMMLLLIFLDGLEVILSQV